MQHSMYVVPLNYEQKRTFEQEHVRRGTGTYIGDRGRGVVEPCGTANDRA